MMIELKKIKMQDGKTKITTIQLFKGERDYIIIIMKADKGGVVVIIEVEDYMREAESQLKDKNKLNELNYDPTEA